jgi:hypothetical protein
MHFVCNENKSYKVFHFLEAIYISRSQNKFELI